MKVNGTKFILILMSISVIALVNTRSKRGISENFKVLLSIYKLNPLKHSNVFKTFSNRILLPRPDERRFALNYNSNESREKENRTNTKSKTEEINYATHKSVDHSYVKDESLDNFDPGHFLNKLVSTNRVNLNENLIGEDAYNFINDINGPNKVSLNPVQKYFSKSLENNTDGKNYDITQPNVASKNLGSEIFDTEKLNNVQTLEVAETVVVK